MALHNVFAPGSGATIDPATIQDQVQGTLYIVEADTSDDASAIVGDALNDNLQAPLTAWPADTEA
jgi:hypothetical protein